MGQLLKANVLAHLRHFSRARLLVGFAAFLVFLILLFMLPQLLVSSRLNAFEVIRLSFIEAEGMLFVFTGALGLFLIASHLNARNLKMVFTKPCPPSHWLASVFLAGAVVALALDALIVVIASLFTGGLRFHVQEGLLFVGFLTFAECLGVMAYLTVLATIVHPVLAVLFALIFNPSLFYEMDLMMLNFVRSGSKPLFYRGLEWFFHFCYMASPIYFPFSEQTARVSSSLRVDHGMWKYAFGALGYDLAFASLCYCLALFFLQRKRLI